MVRHLLSLLALACLVSAQSQPDPHQVPVMDGESGPCTVSFTVMDAKGAPVYAARIHVHIEYGFGGMRRLDLEAATNIDGKAQFKGLPKKVKGRTLSFRASQGKLEGTATYDPEKSCGGENSAIMLAQQ
jgi:hypothetical protein